MYDIAPQRKRVKKSGDAFPITYFRRFVLRFIVSETVQIPLS